MPNTTIDLHATNVDCVSSVYNYLLKRLATIALHIYIIIHILVYCMLLKIERKYNEFINQIVWIYYIKIKVFWEHNLNV